MCKPVKYTAIREGNQSAVNQNILEVGVAIVVHPSLSDNF